MKLRKNNIIVNNNTNTNNINIKELENIKNEIKEAENKLNDYFFSIIKNMNVKMDEQQDKYGIVLDLLQNLCNDEKCIYLIKQYKIQKVTNNDIVKYIKDYITTKYQNEIPQISNKKIKQIISYLIKQVGLEQLKLELNKLAKSHK